jgi:hypothetical protein
MMKIFIPMLNRGVAVKTLAVSINIGVFAAVKTLAVTDSIFIRHDTTNSCDGKFRTELC